MANGLVGTFVKRPQEFTAYQWDGTPVGAIDLLLGLRVEGQVGYVGLRWNLRIRDKWVTEDDVILFAAGPGWGEMKVMREDDFEAEYGPLDA